MQRGNLEIWGENQSSTPIRSLLDRLPRQQALILVDITDFKIADFTDEIHENQTHSSIDKFT